jgi:hypothetical protein
MVEIIDYTGAANPPPQAHTALFNGLHKGVDYVGDKGIGSTDQSAGAPLQIFPEIHGKPGKSDRSGVPEGHHDHAVGAEKTVPLPPPRPHDLDKALGAKGPVDNALHKVANTDTNKAGLGAPSHQAQAAVKQFVADTANLSGKDKAVALKKLATEFNQAITMADTAYDKIEKQAEPDRAKAREGYVVFNSLYQANYGETIDEAKSLPAPQQQQAKSILDALALNGALMPSQDELTKVFKDYPNFLNSMIELGKSQETALFAAQQWQMANEPVTKAAREQHCTRMWYELAARSVGDQGLAKGMYAERQMLDEQTKELTAAPTELRRVDPI